MDVYISGNHVAHYCPDLIPGEILTVSWGCLLSGGLWVAGLFVNSTPVGWVGFGYVIMGGIVVLATSCP